jgi:SAM-dependent methyltransferase
MSSVGGAADGLTADGGSLGTGSLGNQLGNQAAGRRSTAGARARTAQVHGGVSDLFARALRDYAHQHPGQPVKLLRAGCTGSADDLGLGQLPARSFEVSVKSVDEDHPLTRKLAEGAADRGAPLGVDLGDLRTIPLAARVFDVVYCAHLLDRIEHAELVLDHLVAALKPGGLLLLRFRDRECAAGRLDRLLPLPARRAIWPWLRPEQAGPFRAVFEPLASADGVQSYVLRRGLVIAERQALRDRPRRPARTAWGAPVACRLLAWFSRGRLTDSHDDLLYVVRKPENRFARVL